MGFTERFPRWITLLIGVAQFVLTAAILALELVSAYIDLAHGTIWAGLWSSLIFIPTFLIMLFITCCCRGRYYAFYVLIFTVLSGLLACVIIYFDQLFMNNLCQCYLGNQLCCAIGGIPSFQQNYTSVLQDCAEAVARDTSSAVTCRVRPVTKLPYIQAQLAAACAMLVVCAIYVVVFLFACLGVCFGHDN